jgi:very-short-patch-repair endonuclease
VEAGSKISVPSRRPSFVESKEPSMPDPHPDVRIDRLARLQHGAFSRAQAFDVGMTARMITTRLASGRWVGLDRGVYALGSHEYSWERQAMAATLAVPGSAVSGRSAACLHGIDGFRPASLELMVLRPQKARTSLARVRRSGHLQATIVRRIPCLTVAHTILSLAGLIPDDRLDAAVDEVLARRLVTIDELQDRFALASTGRRRGFPVLRRILGEKGGGFVPPTSQLERRLRRFLAAPDLPRFEYEFELPWWPHGQGRVDAYAPSCSLIVEADGRGWHNRERNMAADRTRDNIATANGHGTLRFTWVDLTRYVDENLAVLRQTIATRRGITATVASFATAQVVDGASVGGAAVRER